MTSWIVIDSGVLIASAIEEAYTVQADSLLEWIDTEKMSIAAPTLLRYEVTSTLRKLAHRGAIASADGERLLEQILKRPIDLMIDTDLLERAYALATEYGLPAAYDAQYLAVAERLSCPLWTFDKRLFNLVREKLTWVHYAPNFVLPSAPGDR
jgi:predicted nucleic acid-binding protein